MAFTNELGSNLLDIIGESNPNIGNSGSIENIGKAIDETSILQKLSLKNPDVPIEINSQSSEFTSPVEAVTQQHVNQSINTSHACSMQQGSPKCEPSTSANTQIPAKPASILRQPTTPSKKVNFNPETRIIQRITPKSGSMLGSQITIPNQNNSIVPVQHSDVISGEVIELNTSQQDGATIKKVNDYNTIPSNTIPSMQQGGIDKCMQQGSIDKCTKSFIKITDSFQISMTTIYFIGMLLLFGCVIFYQSRMNRKNSVDDSNGVNNTK